MSERRENETMEAYVIRTIREDEREKLAVFFKTNFSSSTYLYPEQIAAHIRSFK
jgi:hypothetical protein